MTKKDIQKVLRTLNRTLIFKTASKCGVSLTKDGATYFGVYNFIKYYSPSLRVSKKAWEIATPIKKEFFTKSTKTYKELIDYTIEQLNGNHGRYTKLPFIGFTHLYFCSPIFGHADYNKWCSIKIEGNEKFCEKLIEYAHKHYDY